MMEDYRAMIRNTFEFGSVRDAEALFEACIENAPAGFTQPSA